MVEAPFTHQTYKGLKFVPWGWEYQLKRLSLYLNIWIWKQAQQYLRLRAICDFAV